MVAAQEKVMGRFAFGKNWQSYLERVNDARIEKAVQSLRDMLAVETLKGKRFLDIGCGSGLFSLAAQRLGAEVTSFDYDLDSVEATSSMKNVHAPDAKNWTVQQGDVLDDDFVQGLGEFDVVYSWGVLHHTGQMWPAIEKAIARVAPGGKFFIALYNDQGGNSRRWKVIKKLYVHSPSWLKMVVVWAVILYFELRYALVRLLRFKNPFPDWKKDEQEQLRGMSMWHDYVDWVGGYPFEVAKPDEVFSFCKTRRLELEKLITVVNSHGCNEYVFSRKNI
ncbi:MAG: SAM-dependent methyltransferase [Micavibrio sp.]|nr:MAG: SAM-dependent methyltransferase [Micavibrio sp.]